jgi:hypothetical protein
VGVIGSVRLFAQVVPSGLRHVDTVVFGGGFDVGEGLFALLISDVFDLIEAGDGVPNVGSVCERLFALGCECVDGGREFVALFCVEGFIVFVMLPGCFHGGLQSEF